MSYFRERNNLKKDYSGHEEVSERLRNCITTITQGYIGRNPTRYNGYRDHKVEENSLERELEISIGKSDFYGIINQGSYDEVFEAVEILLSLATAKLDRERSLRLLVDIIRCFDNAGSVYTLTKDGHIELSLDEESVQKLEEADKVLEGTPLAREKMTTARVNLVKRQDSPSSIVRDAHVAFEEFLKFKTGEKKFADAIKGLHSKNVISASQKRLVEQLYSYRSATKGVAHAGDDPEPDEIDALWFLETVGSQISLMNNKLKQGDSESE